jgi:hypothetical protein
MSPVQRVGCFFKAGLPDTVLGNAATLRRSGSHIADKDTVELQKAEDGQGLISNAYYRKFATVGADYFEQSNNRPHTRAVNQAKRRKVDEYAGRSLLADLAYGRSEVDDRERIKLTFNTKE